MFICRLGLVEVHLHLIFDDNERVDGGRPCSYRLVDAQIFNTADSSSNGVNGQYFNSGGFVELPNSEIDRSITAKEHATLSSYPCRVKAHMRCNDFFSLLVRHVSSFPRALYNVWVYPAPEDASMFFLAHLLLLSGVALGTPVLEKRADPLGIDVSSYQPSVNWNTVKANGVTFAYIKATEGTTYQNPSFSSQYTGATNAGIIRGSYHFAHPDSSSGAAQANYFLAHGGGWSGDGITLPGALDIEYNPNGATCYGLSAAAMVNWITDFSNTYHAATTRYPVIYTTTDWWTTCTGNSAKFASTNPLWIARYASAIGTLPAGWGYTTFWQYADSGANPGDQDKFNGDAAGLKRMATG